MRQMTAACDNEIVLEFRDVSLSFDEKQVLSHINLKVERGEMIFITGESGSGKSVLLRLAMALDHPDSGQVLIEPDVGQLANCVLKTGRLVFRDRSSPVCCL